MLRKTSRNKGNPYQHFIFTGDVGKQGLDVVDIKDVNSEEFKHIFNTRQHTGKYSKGYSRKSRKFGGKDMIVSISGNVKNGLIHSPSSTGVYAINLLLVELELIVMEELGNMMNKLELMFLLLIELLLILLINLLEEKLLLEVIILLEMEDGLKIIM